MTILGVIGYVVGFLGVAFALRCYLELRRWAYQCKYARIVVAYKGKVKLNAPITEWVLWCNQLDKDKDSNGRVVYKLGGSSVAIIKKSFVPKTPAQRLIDKHTRPQKATNRQVRQGTWKAEDQTKVPSK